MSNEPICEATIIFRFMRGRWAPPLLKLLAEQGPIHFLAICRSIPSISRKVLTEELRNLEHARVVLRSVDEGHSPPQVFYSLTPQGIELKEGIDGLNSIADEWPAVEEPLQPTHNSRCQDMEEKPLYERRVHILK